MKFGFCAFLLSLSFLSFLLEFSDIPETHKKFPNNFVVLSMSHFLQDIDTLEWEDKAQQDDCARVFPVCLEIHGIRLCFAKWCAKSPRNSLMIWKINQHNAFLKEI